MATMYRARKLTKYAKDDDDEEHVGGYLTFDQVRKEDL